MVARRKFNPELASTLFALAESFLELNPVIRFKIGKELNLVDENDVINYGLEELDKKIFCGMVDNNLLPEFVQLIYAAE